MSATETERDAAAGVTPEFLPRCPQCDYILHGLTDNRCPECGRPFQPSDLLTSRIPWEQRRQLGHLRAYRRTVWMVTRSSHVLTSERGMHVRLVAARRFRRLTALWVALPLMTAWGVFAGVEIFPNLAGAGLLEWVLTVVVLPCHCLAAYAVIGVPSWFLRLHTLSESRQETAVALSYYAAAPLAWCPLLGVVTLGVRGLAELSSGPWTVMTGILALCATALIPGGVAVWWFRLVGLVSAYRGRPASVAAAVVVPILWAVVGLGIGIGLPLSFLWLVLALESLR